jgi:hypothetical protein
MGFNTSVLVLNDRLSEIERDPEEFVKELCRMAGSGKARGPHPIDFHGSQSGVIETHHADQTAVILVGGNTATVMGYHGGWKHNEPEGQVACLRTVLADLGYEVRSMPEKRLKQKLKWAKSQLATAKGFDPSRGGTRSVPFREYRAWEREVKFHQERVEHIELMLRGEKED